MGYTVTSLYDGHDYRLNENAGRENILVRYIPEEYVWENLYMTEDKLVRDYVENIRDVNQVYHILMEGR